jgi:hypothetical protein
MNSLHELSHSDSQNERVLSQTWFHCLHNWTMGYKTGAKSAQTPDFVETLATRIDKTEAATHAAQIRRKRMLAAHNGE